MAQDLSLHVAGLQLAARVWGPQDGEPVLALHGWLDNAATFDAMAPHMAGVRLCALDFAGHGRSAHRPPGVPYHLIDNVTDVIGAADALQWPRFSLLAHSMGAGVGALLAGAFPDRVRKCVFLDGFGPVSSTGDKAPENLRRSVLQLLGLKPRPAAVFKSLEECARARVVGGHTAISMAAARILSARNARQLEGGFAWRTDGRLRFTSPLRLTESQVCGFIAGIEAPVLVIGAKDGLAKMSSRYEKRVAAARDLRVEMLPGGHHFHLEEQAPDVARLALEFLTA